MNKKADITFIVVIVLITIISFGVIATYVIQTNNIISTSKDDIICNTFIQLKGEGIYNIVDLFYQINSRCKVDEIIIDTANNQKVYKTFADTSVSCYDRYGKGEFDFLEKYKAQGNWCFLCGKVEFKDNIQYNSDFFDFIKWTQKNSIPNNNSISYYDYTNFVYSNINEDNIQELETLEQDINELIAEVSGGEFSELIDVSLLTLEQYQTIVDYQLKNFDSSQEYYVTYRYDRLEKTMDQVQQEAMGAIIGGLATSIGTEVVLGILTGGIGTIKAILTAPAKLIKIAKLNKIFTKMKEFIYFSKKSKTLSYLDETVSLSSASGKTVRISEKLLSFNPNVDDLKGFSELLKLDPKHAELGKRFENIAETMEKNNVKTFNDLNKLKPTKELVDNLKYFVNADIPVGEGINAQKLSSQVKNMQSFAAEDILKLTPDNPSLFSKSMSTIKNVLRVTAFSTGSFLGLIYAQEEAPSNQYVDIMTKEEFYRNCGFLAGTTATK